MGDVWTTGRNLGLGRRLSQTPGRGGTECLRFPSSLGRLGQTGAEVMPPPLTLIFSFFSGLLPGTGLGVWDRRRGV